MSTARAKIDAAKPQAYSDARKAFEADHGGYRFCFRVPCSGALCTSELYIYDAEELDAVQNGRVLCPHCAKHGISRAEAAWREACPRVFREGASATDPQRLPEAAFGKIRRWAQSVFEADGAPCRSLYVFGNTGTCKSRMAFLAMRQFAERGYSYRVFKGGGLRDAFSKCYGEGCAFDAVSVLKKSLAALDVLMFDDFGQDDFTEGQLSDLWAILDARFSEGKPTVFLSNFAPRNLIARYGKRFSMDSLVRRIEEFCDIARS